jgi:hypothetical protein
VLPEPKFFSVETFCRRGVAWYAEHYFSAADPETIVGEKSVTYMDHPAAARRIRKTLPDVLLIFILRNPTDRAYSHYLYSKKNLLESTPTFAEAIITEPWRDRRCPSMLTTTRPWSYMARSRYVHDLRRFYDEFSDNQIKVVFYEEFFSDLAGGAAEVCQFLGVRNFAEELTLARINAASGDGAPEMAAAMREFLDEGFRADNRALSQLLGRSLPSNWST